MMLGTRLGTCRATNSLLIYSCSLLMILVNSICNCSPQDYEATNRYKILNAPFADISKSWIDNVIEKLENFVTTTEVNLEKYMNARYLPHLKVVAALIDFKIDHYDSNMSKSAKALLRISTIHAYLMIHQTALTSSAVQLFVSFLISQKKIIKYRMSDDELKSTLMYLNYQIRTSALEDKSEYLLEFAYLCSKYENTNNQPTLEMERLVDYLKFKTSESIRKRDELRVSYGKVESKLSQNIKNSLDFKKNDLIFQKSIDDFYLKHGLAALLSGYLFMSYDKDNTENKLKLPRKFGFKRYFDYRTKSSEVTRLRYRNDLPNSFDPILPLDFSEIAQPGDEQELMKLLYKIADDPIALRFREELEDIALPSDEFESETLAILVSKFEEINLPKLLGHKTNNTSGNDSKIRAALLDGTSKVVIEHQILKGCVLDRFVRLAKKSINYEDDIAKSRFVVPFRNSVFGLRCQKLLFAFYPVMMSQASDSVSELSSHDFNLDKNVIENCGKIKKTSELSGQLDKLYKALKQYQRRENIVSSIRAHKFEEEVKEFRKLPYDAQDYFVAFNDAALGAVLSLYLDATYHEMDHVYDFLRMRVVANLKRDQQLIALSLVYGKTIESNVMLWLRNRKDIK